MSCDFMTGWQNQENKRRETQRPGCYGNEHQDNRHHCAADDPDAVRGSLHLGDQQCLLQPQHCAGVVQP